MIGSLPNILDGATNHLAGWSDHVRPLLLMLVPGKAQPSPGPLSPRDQKDWFYPSMAPLGITKHPDSQWVLVQYMFSDRRCLDVMGS